MVTPKGIDELWTLLRERLAEPGYAASYATEAAFEVDVWRRVVALAIHLGLDVRNACLTSHVGNVDRSATAWEAFSKEEFGPDVTVLGANNRLDIVLRHPEYGSIGIEVKCLGAKGHASKLTQGLGQVLLGVAHRDRTVLVIHCGTVGTNERDRLRHVGNRISDGLKIGLVVVP